MVDFAFDVFLSYAHEDSRFARDVATWLRRVGISVWVDEEQLVPGSRFRAGLQQGLRDSRHMVVVLTSAYCTRPWTQRELDLFDLTADHSARRLLALQRGELAEGPIDQVVLVHQRIPWRADSFDPEAFWKLYCGLTDRGPGPYEEWAGKGTALLGTVTKRSSTTGGPTEGDSRLLMHLSARTSRHLSAEALIARVRSTLGAESPYWIESFRDVRGVVQQAPREIVADVLLTLPWAVGAAEVAAVVALSWLPQAGAAYSAWPFLDLACAEIADWFLVLSAIETSEPSEIWFSWVVFNEWWSLLPDAANRAPGDTLRRHLEYLAVAAARRDRTFRQVEEDYDYGVMITPWNHFHLSWLAARLDDPDAASSHASKLCSATSLGDDRAGRFLNRLTTWDVFSGTRSREAMKSPLRAARKYLELQDSETLPGIRSRLLDIWRYARDEWRRVG